MVEAAHNEAKQCKNGGKGNEGKGAELDEKMSPTKNVMYECMTDSNYYRKYEDVCKKAKLNAMASGDYKV